MDKYAPTATHPSLRTPTLPASIRALLDASRALEKHLERALPVQLATLAVLDALASDPGITLSPLANRLGLERQTVHGTLGRVDRLGLLTKVRDEKDGRVSHCYLSPAGIKMLDDCRLKLGTIGPSLVSIIEQHEPGWAEDLADQLENFAP